MKSLLLLLCAAVLSGCTYDDAAAFGSAANRVAASYYRTGYAPAEPVYPRAQPVYYP